VKSQGIAEQRRCQPDQVKRRLRNSLTAHYFAVDRHVRAPFEPVAAPGRAASEREDGRRINVARLSPLCYTVDHEP